MIEESLANPDKIKKMLASFLTNPSITGSSRLLPEIASKYSDIYLDYLHWHPNKPALEKKIEEFQVALEN